MEAFLISFGIIFVAELGDKSQLMAMTFAARYRAVTILIAITAATAFVHLFSVLIGAAVGVAMPTKVISVVAGVAFLGFAVWTIRGDELDDDDAARVARSSKSVFFTVAIAFFLAELGQARRFGEGVQRILLRRAHPEVRTRRPMRGHVEIDRRRDQVADPEGRRKRARITDQKDAFELALSPA